MPKNIIACLLLGVFTVAQAAENDSATVIDLGGLLTIDQLLEKVADRQVIFVSESHLKYEHHLNQLAVIKSQHEQHDNLVIGLEFIQKPFQSVLNDYIAGNIDEADMLRKTEYFDRWKYDFRLYRPIFSYAREHGIPLIALNIEQEVTDQIGTVGLDGLSDDLKKRLPTEIVRDDEAYRARLMNIFKQHPHADDKDFENFQTVQLLWDESMAETAANWLQQHPQDHMVILAGSGHIIYGSGIPNRLKRRIPLSTAIVINADAEMGINADMGDFLVMSEPRTLPDAGKLGVLLDTEKSPPRVTGFGVQSGAEQAGMEKGDQIIRIDDTDIASYADIRIALLGKIIGDKVTVEIIRDSIFFGIKNRSFTIELR